MKRKSTTIGIVGLMLLYLLGALCSNMVAPSAAVASTLGGCSDSTSTSGNMFPCEHPNFSCRSTGNDNKNAIVPSRQTRDSAGAKERAFVTIEVISPPDLAASAHVNGSHTTPPGFAQNIPIHILKSVLSI